VRAEIIFASPDQTRFSGDTTSTVKFADI